MGIKDKYVLGAHLSERKFRELLRLLELDESYFGARHVRGRRGRGAFGKTIVFGLLKRGGRVHTRIVPDLSRKTLMSVVEQQEDKEVIMYTGRLCLV